MFESIWLANLKIREVWVARHRLREDLAGDQAESGGLKLQTLA